jgi:hypothetical protein
MRWERIGEDEIGWEGMGGDATRREKLEPGGVYSSTAWVYVGPTRTASTLAMCGCALAALAWRRQASSESRVIPAHTHATREDVRGGEEDDERRRVARERHARETRGCWAARRVRWSSDLAQMALDHVLMATSSPAGSAWCPLATLACRIVEKAPAAIGPSGV